MTSTCLIIVIVGEAGLTCAHLIHKGLSSDKELKSYPFWTSDVCRIDFSRNQRLSGDADPWPQEWPVIEELKVLFAAVTVQRR